MIAVAALGDLAEFIRGVTFKPEQVSTPDDVEAVACLRTKNVQAQLETSDLVFVPRSVVKNEAQMVRHGDIVISSANSWNLVGKSSWVGDLDFEAAIGGFICLLRVTRDDVDARYLYRWFSSPRIQAIVRSFGQKTTNISNLNLGRARELEVPLPPLPEQRRIAAILDQADELRSKRRRALTLLDELADSVFVDMFGKNKSGLSSVALGDLVSFSSGRFLPAKKMVEGGDVPVFGGNGINGHHDEAMFDVPQIVVGRVGAYCGVVHGTPAKSWVTDNALIARWDSKIFHFDYLRDVLTQSKLNALASQSGQPLISAGRIAGVQIAVPSMALQLEYSVRIKEIQHVGNALQIQLESFGELFVSLQHRAFRGEL